MNFHFKFFKQICGVERAALSLATPLSAFSIVYKNFTLQHQIETLKFGRMQHVKFIT